jgi:hypothetical protein
MLLVQPQGRTTFRLWRLLAANSRHFLCPRPIGLTTPLASHPEADAFKLIYLVAIEAAVRRFAGAVVMRSLPIHLRQAPSTITVITSADVAEATKRIGDAEVDLAGATKRIGVAEEDLVEALRDNPAPDALAQQQERILHFLRRARLVTHRETGRKV